MCKLKAKRIEIGCKGQMFKAVMDFSCVGYSAFKSYLLLPSSNLLGLSEEYYLMPVLSIVDVWLLPI